ncbi:MAG: HAMP domain-containing histidine kinase [Chitinophagaceae bacterium]|jgi:signal transduction histidine kinase|nr:HAMP domain-containing histidine kinase [Chitinophagaceae bacterium]
MIQKIKKQKLLLITAAYWLLLLYIVVALGFWYMELKSQNNLMYAYRLEELKKDDPLYAQKSDALNDAKKRKEWQYIGEGSTFLLIIFVGAIFVYRATRKQIRLSQQQQNFMMAITHELKTPIATTKLNLETLVKRNLNQEQQHKLLTNAIKETDRLNILTGNILTASQLESGSHTVNFQEVNLSEIAEQCFTNLERRFPGQQLERHILPNVFVQGDEQLLQILLNNLLENAVKYTPEDAKITLTLKTSGDKKLLEIADTGNGIADNEKTNVFKKFYRIGDESVRKAKGTGLGLYLCKKIAEYHKGSLLLSDNVPHGCVFGIRLP